MTEMLPCPFCGGADVEIVHCEPDCCGAQPIYVRCDCGLMLNVDAENDAEAIAAWNTRVDTQQQGESDGCS